MIRAVCGCIVALAAMMVSGCMTGPGDHGWVTDPEFYWKLSGFSVQAPSGSGWYKNEQDINHPNGIGFSKVEPTAIRFNPYHPEFTITGAFAYGTAIAPISTDIGNEAALRKLLAVYTRKAGVAVEDSTYDDSLGADCLRYRGNMATPDVQSPYGVIRYQSVRGYLCLHPDYQDFIIGMESRNGASVEIMPLNRDEQVEHFFKSLRFTPRATVPAGSPSKATGRATG